jgi:hypothetical protein
MIPTTPTTLQTSLLSIMKLRTSFVIASNPVAANLFSFAILNVCLSYSLPMTAMTAQTAPSTRALNFQVPIPVILSKCANILASGDIIRCNCADLCTPTPQNDCKDFLSHIGQCETTTSAPKSTPAKTSATVAPLTPAVSQKLSNPAPAPATSNTAPKAPTAMTVP